MRFQKIIRDPIHNSSISFACLHDAIGVAECETLAVQLSSCGTMHRVLP